MVAYAASNDGVTVNLSDSEPESGGHAEGDTLINVGSIWGSPHNDTLTGNALHNHFYDFGGSDTYDGKGGADTVYYFGSYVAATNSYTGPAVTLNMADPTKSTGWAAGDTFTSIEAIGLSTRSDTFTGDSGNNVVGGNAGDDTLNGGGGNDKLNGSTGNDTLNGGAGNDLLWGGTGNDILNGGAGNDQLEAGSGNDSITGGGGTDEFAYHAGNDTITDYQAGEKIYICVGQNYDSGFSTTFVTWAQSDSSGNRVVTISLGGTVYGTITLTGRTTDVPASDLVWSDPDHSEGCNFI